MVREVGRRPVHVDTYRPRPSVCAALDATVSRFWGMEGKHGHIVQAHYDSGTNMACATRQVQAAREVRPPATHQGAEGR